MSTTRKDCTMNRRRSFLKTSAVLATALTVPAVARAAAAAPHERLALV
ncbi:twin-arginine translocation signal domain-containing protein [Massilia sp. B-10]|nr:twin-arginine translocation signal domain-containing protein [Massilia sp. B-10]